MTMLTLYQIYCKQECYILACVDPLCLGSVRGLEIRLIMQFILCIILISRQDICIPLVVTWKVMDFKTAEWLSYLCLI